MTPVPSEIYCHTKSGKRYRIVAIAKDSETLEDMVVYEALYDVESAMKTWVRPVKMFTEEVEIDGVKHPRFTKE